ncbi:hypothetical protein [Lutimonas sp.]|uniref:hypothetical protein n=1 Tax=Lutimonas sp. TaxID=1872403 RepID=UPI003D9BE6BF
MNQEENDEGLLKIQAKEISDLFAMNEGRRPRLLIAAFETVQEKKLLTWAGLFADLGCNVDIAPYKSKLEHIQRQCVENDTDILLLLTDGFFQNEPWQDFLTSILTESPHMIAALHTSQSKSSVDLYTYETSWSFFDQDDLPVVIVSTLLKKLLSEG